MFFSVQEKDATKAATMCSALATPSRAEKAELSRLLHRAVHKESALLALLLI